MKSIGIIALVVIFASCSSPKPHKAGLVKTDTIMALYLTQAYGSLQGGPAIRTISYKEKVSTKDSVTFTKSVDLDTNCTVFTQQPVIDSVTKKQKKDSLGNPQFSVIPVNLPAKYIQEVNIATH